MNKTILLTGSFIKKDMLRIRNVFLILIPLLAGASIIIGNRVLSHHFDDKMVYYMYAYIAQYLMLYFSVSYWGMEFQKKTINLLIISGQKLNCIYLSKLFAYIFHVLVYFIFAFLEIAIYKLISNDNNLIMDLFGSMLISYLMYGGFVFACSTIIVMLTKNIIISLVASWMLMSVVPAITMLLQASPIAAYIQYVPFSFIVEVFSFSKFTIEQLIISMIWIFIMSLIGYILFRKRGNV